MDHLTDDQFQNQVVPQTDQQLVTPDFMSAQLSFDDLFYSGGGPDLEPKGMLDGAHSTQGLLNSDCNPTLMQNDQMLVKQELFDTPSSCFGGVRSYSCPEASRKYSTTSSTQDCYELLASSSQHEIKTEPASPCMMTAHSLNSSNTHCTGQSNEHSGQVQGMQSIFPDIDSSLEIYRDLILNHLVADIKSTCSKLGIPTDPQQWQPDQTLIWLQEMTAQFHLGDAPLAQLYQPGGVICTMSQDDFLQASPDNGDTLYAQLQIWKTAAEFSSGTDGMANGSYTGQQAENFGGYGSSASSASDWLASFDPSVPSFVPPNSLNFPAGGLSVGTSNGGVGHLLNSPCGSDSGISADFDDYHGGSSPIQAQVIPTSTGSIHLWQFIRELLDHPDRYGSCVRWLDRTDGIFKIEDSHKLARLWGQRKNRSKMNYDKLSRSLRQYYKKNIIRKTGQRQRLIYQFIPPYHLL